MPLLRQNDRERSVGMVHAGMTHQAVADHFNVSGITQIFRMANCLLLLTAQLMTACDLNA
jgi:hypothetical protein